MLVFLLRTIWLLCDSHCRSEVETCKVWRLKSDVTTTTTTVFPIPCTRKKVANAAVLCKVIG